MPTSFLLLDTKNDESEATEKERVLISSGHKAWLTITLIFLWGMDVVAASGLKSLTQNWMYCPGDTELRWGDPPDSCQPISIPGLPDPKAERVAGKHEAVVSYRLLMEWPDTQESLAFRLSMVFGAYRLWLLRAGNEPYLLAENGRYSLDPNLNQVRIRDRLIPVGVAIPPGEQVQLVLQIASFRGPPLLREAPQFGSLERIQQNWMALQTERAALMGGFLMIFLYCLALFWQRPADLANLWAGLLALVLLVRYISTEWMLGAFWGPDQWSESQNLILMQTSTHLAIVCLAGFIYALYPKKFTLYNFLFCASVYIFLSALSLWKGQTFLLSNLESITYLLMLLHIPPLLYAVVSLLWNRAKDIGWILGGALCLTLASINDFLIYFLHWKGVYLTHYATLGYAFSQSLVTGRRFARTYQENRKLLQEIKDKEHARTLFFHNTSHELRTPLNGIIGFLRLLANDTFGVQAPAARQQLEKCIRLAESLTLQVNTILDLAKSKRGALRLVNTGFSLNQLLQEAETLAEGLLLRRGRASFDRARSWTADEMFCGDKEKVATVIRNLLGNAFKFADIGRLNKVHLRLEKRERELIIEVADTGIGIPEAEINRVFEEFSQLAADARRNYEGTGLGLAMVKDLVQLMGGRIEVQSKLGEGSLFRVWIPEGVATSPVIQEEVSVPSDGLAEMLVFTKKPFDKFSTLEAGSGLEAKKVLVVDDHELNCEVLQHILEHQGYQVLIAYGGREAIDITRRERPDLILLDVMMPLMSGEDVLRELRQDRELADIPILLVTARASDGDRVYGLSLGADDYLAKPIQAEELIFRVRNLLRRLENHGRQVRNEEQDRWVQMGRLLLELSHELKNIFHYSDSSQLSPEARASLYKSLPLRSASWKKACEIWGSGSRESSEARSFDHLPLSAGDMNLKGLRSRIATLPLSLEEQGEIWREILELPEEVRVFCQDFLALLRQYSLVAEQVGLARDVITGILELGRQDSRQTAELSVAYSRLERLFRARWQELSVRVTWPDHPQALGMTHTEFLQVCLNLLGNATDAVAQLPKAERWIEVIREQGEEGTLHLRFRNAGKPISPDRMAEIWEGRSSAAGGRQSFGLGISRRLVQRSGGDLSYNERAAYPEFVISWQMKRSSAENSRASGVS